MKLVKFYVVWVGHTPGVFQDYADCLRSVTGYANAKFKSYMSYEEATRAFERGPIQTGDGDAIANNRMAKEPTNFFVNGPEKPIEDSLVVDASCLQNPGSIEFQGIHLASRERKFHVGRLSEGTNNMGEYLAIVFALAYLWQLNSSIAIYSDSKTALWWAREKGHGSKQPQNNTNKEVFEQLDWADNWLKTHRYHNPLLKWKIRWWGENPADFGHK
jgi:ribonuclease HI